MRTTCTCIYATRLLMKLHYTRMYKIGGSILIKQMKYKDNEEMIDYD